MPSGSHGRGGPPPDPNALRRERDGGSWIDLPAEGRPGEPPVWPLVKPSRRELALWRSEWRRPQAIAWERNGQQLEVALYVRGLAEAERPNAPAARLNLVRQAQEALGLSMPGLLRNRWRIVADDLAAARRPVEDDRTERARLKAALQHG